MSNCDLRGELARTKLRLEVLRAGITKLNGEIAQLRVEAGVYEGKASMLARVTKLLHDAVPYANGLYTDPGQYVWCLVASVKRLRIHIKNQVVCERKLQAQIRRLNARIDQGDRVVGYISPSEDEPIPDDYYIDAEKREPTNDKSTH